MVRKTIQLPDYNEPKYSEYLIQCHFILINFANYMLNNSFYIATLMSNDAALGHAQYEITFSKNHPIFKGHFPNQPVVPGVTLIQMTKELVVSGFRFPFKMNSIISTKFLQVINPLDNKSYILNLSIRQEGNTYLIDATLKAEDISTFKFKAKLIKGEQ